MILWELELRCENQFCRAKDPRFAFDILSQSQVHRCKAFGCPRKTYTDMGSSRDELKAGAKRQRAFDAADRDHLSFHGLVHHFEDARAELGELIQEYHAAMRKGYFTGLGNVSSAH
jgi:hypothetical protein